MYKIYQIEYGDNLDIIAKKTNTSVENIKNLNDINSDNELVVGSLIIVPKVENQMFNTYRVLKGDTIFTIAKQNNIDPNTILLLNGLNQSDYIYPDQELILPRDDVQVYITKSGDTINDVIDNFNVDINELVKENNKLYLVEDQLIIHKKM